MKFLVLSDIHGDVAALDRLDAAFAAADAVLFGGDFAQFAHTETALPVLKKLCAKHEVIFSVLGNCDEPEFLTQLEDADISVQGSVAWHEGLAFAGSGGGSRFTGTTPFERDDEELAGDFAVVADSPEGADADGHWNNLVLIMHNPPKDTACDLLPNGAHVGSAALRAFIEQTAPLAVVTGHIHESAGIDHIGTTAVINPGSLAEGKYGWLECEKSADGWHVTNAELRTL